METGRIDDVEKFQMNFPAIVDFFFHTRSIFMKTFLQKLFFSCFICLMPCLVLVSFSGTAQTRRPMEIGDLFRARRVSDPQLSPDGKWVAFVVTVVYKDSNKSNSDIWLIPSAGGEAKQLTNSPKHDRHPRWSPDGKSILFESNRSGDFQIYRMNAEGNNVQQLTTIATEANQAIWSPDGKSIAFVSAVFPEFSDIPYEESDSLNKQKMDAHEKSKVKARIITKLLYRHWDSWVDDKRQHIFVMALEGGDPRDNTPGDRDAIPTSSTFSAGDDFSFSPDGGELAYTATPTPPHSESWSTNHDIYIVNLNSGERKQLTTNPAADGYPQYSPDGKYIAYRAQSQPGFEADRWQLMLYNRSTHTTKSLTESFDSNVGGMVWSTDSKKLYFPAEINATQPIWSVSIKGNDVTKVADNATNDDLQVGKNGFLVFAHVSLSRPTEIYTSSDGNNVKPLTHINDQLFFQIRMTRPESITFRGAAGARVQMWIVKPPDFDPAKKYPLVYMVHGGPQGAWLDSWSYRWCPQLWAAQGYILALPNPRGSTGFGQKFVNEITKDWGGKVFEDLMRGLDTLMQFPYIDTVRKAAAGASFGGYMMNWFEGHTDRFKTIVSHDGTYNFYSSYGVTEETWFDEWEHGIPWETPDFDKFSPNKYAGNFKTPMLLIHGELDFRVPVGEGMQLFTALQRKGIQSKFLYFPDEGHWVLKPQNSELWHKTVFEWLAQFLNP